MAETSSVRLRTRCTTSRKKQWHSLSCAFNQQSCLLARQYGCNYVVANLPCNAYWIQQRQTVFCRAVLDPTTGKPNIDGAGYPYCQPGGRRLRGRTLADALAESGDDSVVNAPHPFNSTTSSGVDE